MSDTEEECTSTVFSGGVDVQCIRTDPHGEYDAHHNGGLTWRKRRGLPAPWGMDPAVEEARRRDPDVWPR